MWGLFRRGNRLPAQARPALERDERVLAWASAAAAAVVVTNRGVWLPGRADRLGWHQVHKAVWSGEVLTITAAEVVARHEQYAVVVDLPPISIELPDPQDVPNQIRARVTRSVGFTLHQPLDGGGFLMVGRRVAGVDGLTWTVRYDPDTDVDAPGLAEYTAEFVAATRSSVERAD
ncbi:hypothetical protein [Micromonospora sp. LOL_023]|uniref:hypothetical protein n=1 Tax=Micromonospora sp. LOL_023 TaxID=3345418 RepID=UPI003A8AE485